MSIFSSQSSSVSKRWLAVLAALVCVLVMGAPFYFADRADRAAADREQQVAGNGLRTLVRTMALRSTSETIWDEAVRNLDIAFDPAWADENIGTYFSQTDSFEAAVVLDRNDEPIYAMRDGVTTPVARASDFAPAYEPLVREIRAAERVRRPIADIIAHEGTMSSPVLASQITRVAGKPYIVAAILVQPDFGTSMPVTARAPIVVTAEALDENVVATFADEFLLTKAHLHEGTQPVEAGHAAVTIYDKEGRAVVALDWLPPRPGAAMVWQALPPLVLVVLLLGAMSLGLFRANAQVTERVIASEARSRHLAYHDALTGLPNRLLLGERLGLALEAVRHNGSSFAVLCIDLDRFKEVNDTFGHQAGDDLIKAAARKIAEVCRSQDTLARIGGDEFAIVQPQASRDAAAALAKRIVEALASPFEIGVGSIFAGGSIGIAIIENAHLEAQECLRRADLALYQVKENGRGHFAFFESELDQTLRTRRQIRDDLRQALTNCELKLYYQPQVHHGEVYGVEALVRWDHPVRGAISPNVFVPIAEESGLIEELGRFTLRQAFLDSQRLPGLRIAVNVSAAQLRLRGFVGQLEALIAETKARPSQFELEVTEGLLLGDDSVIHQTLQRLRELGFRIALDDFGTGYSSLSYLQRYPIDKIKIDRSFIANLGVEDNSDAVVGAIVRLARALKLDVIAEGVETEAQRIRLAAAGCGDIQGYLFGRPAPLDAVCAQIAAGDKERTGARKAASSPR